MGEWELDDDILESARWYYTLSVTGRDCPLLTADADLATVEAYVICSATDPVFHESVRRYVHRP